MKVILLFDIDKLDNTYREYELTEYMVKELQKGKKISISFRHPEFAEEFNAKLHKE